MEPSEDDDAEFVSGVFHFDPPESEWSDRDVCDFIELMITGSCPSRPRRTEKKFSTLAQSSLRNIGEKSGQPIDMLANLVAKKYTCRICGSVDFASQPDRRLHETQCKKRKVEAERAEEKRRRNAVADQMIIDNNRKRNKQSDDY